MGSRKTLELILDEYRQREEMHNNTLIIKPGVDSKAGSSVQTRFGGEERAAILMPRDAEAAEFVTREMAHSLGSAAAWTIYLDEVSLFTPKQILSLRADIVDKDIADVKMYGLLNDAFGNPFPGGEAALKYADRITHQDHICDNKDCDRLAIRNARTINGKILRTGPQIAIDKEGAPYVYMALCHKDYVAGVVRPRTDQ